MSSDVQDTEPQTFVETALKLGGKSEEEARKTGTLDRADEQVEALFAPTYQTVNSPIHRAVWDRELPVDLFATRPPVVSVTSRGPGAAPGAISTRTTAEVGLVTVTRWTVTPAPKDAVVVPARKPVFAPVTVTSTVAPARPPDGATATIAGVAASSTKKPFRSTAVSAPVVNCTERNPSAAPSAIAPP